jgi:hypothetical protein
MILRHLTVFALLLAIATQIVTQRSDAPVSPSKPLALEQLTAAQKQLVDGSRNAIIQTGISQTYFARHFKLITVSDREADRRVVWEFSINGHRARVIDSIGYYTQGSQRIPTHSVSNSLGTTIEIERTLTRATALRRLKSCIGAFENPSVEYGSVDGRAELFLTAEAKQRERRTQAEIRREREREREREEKDRKKAASGTGDLIETEDDERDRSPVIFGSINLVTGKCTKGIGQVAP